MMVSLCMIVKNEEERLGRCLESARRQVDEIVVVDTGSRDATMKVARRYGARCVEFSWNDDFSAARNRSLEEATGDWILWLDADEVLKMPPDGSVSLRRLAAESDADAFVVPIENRKLEGGFELHQAVRFFRRIPGLRFEGAAHERVDGFLLRRGARFKTAPFVIEHYGYAVPREQIQVKLQRNLDLLLAQLERDPHDSFLHYYIGLSYIGIKDLDASYHYLQKAYGLNPPTPNLKCLILNLISYHHLHRQDYREAERHARRSLEFIPRQNTGKLFLGIALYNQERYQEALPLLLQAHQFFQLPAELRKTSISQEHSYSEPELLWALARCCYETGRYPETYQYVRQLEKKGELDAGALLLLALAALKTGALGEAVAALEKARQTGAAEADVGPPLVHAWLQKGEPDAALAAFQTAGATFFANKTAVSVFNELVQKLWDAGREETLYRVLEDKINAGQGHPALLDAFSVCCIRRGEYRRAIGADERLLAQAPESHAVRRRLAALYVKLGDQRRAQQLLAGSSQARATAG